eukprot:gene5700-6401_t
MSLSTGAATADEELSLKRRLEDAEQGLEKSKKQIKLLKKELVSAEKERKEILNTVSSLYAQVQYWNTWLGKRFSGQQSDSHNVDKTIDTRNCNQNGMKNEDLNAVTQEQKQNSDRKKRMETNSSSTDFDLKEVTMGKPQKDTTSETLKSKEQENSAPSVADMLKETAQSALANTGMSYDERSGLYYDWKSHMYYDPTSHLYYDNDNGIYYYYDAEKRTYVFHSQIKVQEKQSLNLEDSDDGGEKSEGEISSSEDEQEVGQAPCIRAIIKTSTSLKSGSLYLITCNGATVGQDESKHLLHIPDVEASKDHAQICYRQTENQYYLRDEGSVNGTFLNDKRVSEPKVQSEWVQIKHKDYLRVGTTTICLHLHCGQETCEECEPGQVQALLSAAAEEKAEFSYAQPSREALRKKQLKGLKHKYMLGGDGLREAMEATSSGKYKDRADKRRKTIGSSHPDIAKRLVAPAKAASVNEMIPQENKGHKMMKSMGWKAGEGLGKEKSGITEPINVIVREQNKGLGKGVSKSLDEAGGKSSNYKWKKAKERYNDILDQEKKEAKNNEEMFVDDFF